MSHYNRLVLVACKDPRSVRVVLIGAERRVRVSSLGSEEWLDIELGHNGQAEFKTTLRTEGLHDIPTGFGWINVTKGGQGSPTTVELLRDG